VTLEIVRLLNFWEKLFDLEAVKHRTTSLNISHIWHHTWLSSNDSGNSF